MLIVVPPAFFSSSLQALPGHNSGVDYYARRVWYTLHVAKVKTFCDGARILYTTYNNIIPQRHVYNIR